MTENLWFKLASLSMALNIALGAFGTHVLKNHLSEKGLAIFEIAWRYHMIHSLGIFIVGFLTAKSGLFNNNWIQIAGIFFIAGLLLFSGGLYLLSGEILPSWFHAIVPLGGLSFILGWIFLFLGVK